MKRHLHSITVMAIGMAIGILWSPTWSTLQTQAQGSQGCQSFPQTGHKVCGKFLTYWQRHGGLTQQGYLVSEEFTEMSDLNGKPYTVQYFERAVFELHPENKPPFDVLLSQLGTYVGKQKYAQGFSATAGATPYQVAT